ncbi:MAG: hypothetical protein V1874_08055 [Spirochaetota bacterium]
MKKSMICFCFALSLIFCSAAAMAAEKVGVNDAVKKGMLSITVFGRANGELAELRFKRLTSAPIIILLNKGRTDIMGEVSVLSKDDLEIDLTSKYEEAIVLKQTGASRVTRGNVLIDASSGK